MLTDSSLTQHLRMHALPNFFPKYYFYLSECLYVCLPAVLLHSQPFHYACLQRQSSPLDWCLYFPLYSLFARYHFPSPRYPSLLSYLTVGPSIRPSVRSSLYRACIILFSNVAHISNLRPSPFTRG